jgi:hypothetical protein
MCWMCAPVRPVDGPKEIQLPDEISYKKGTVVYTALEDEWDLGCSVFPDFESDCFCSRPETVEDITISEYDEAHPSLWECYGCNHQIELRANDEIPKACSICSLPFSYCKV